MIQLRWHDYRYFPYERDLAKREVQAVLGIDRCDLSKDGIRIADPIDAAAASRLTYFSHIDCAAGVTPTTQRRLEEAARSGRSRQATRYSVHGLHEYKGKFNPQVAKAILNIFSIGKGSRVLDPFCGSGTTIVESAHLGAAGIGVDVNPLAVFLANAKLACLSMSADVLRNDLNRLVKRISLVRKPALPKADSERDDYLRSWFDLKQLAWIETLRRHIETECTTTAPVFLAIASDLLRDYSDQEPADLRVRRRNTPLPEIDFRDAFSLAATRFVNRVEAAQIILGVRDPLSRAILSDVRTCDIEERFDAALTSPPYATALPYIDTQRLSLVWLGLCDPRGIGGLDAQLIGSREMKKSERVSVEEELRGNALALPKAQFAFCKSLAKAIGPEDGFRRKAVPQLIYRYFVHMRDGFAAVSTLLHKGAPYALIVGHNHTVLSGIRRDINTPVHLAALARSVGWEVDEKVPLQTYKRFGLHAANAVEAETLLILRNQ